MYKLKKKEKIKYGVYNNTHSINNYCYSIRICNKNNPEDAFLEKDRKGKIIVAILLTVATLLGGGYVLMSYIK